MNSTREKPNPYKIFGIASGITFLGYIYLKMNEISLVFLPVIFIVFFVIFSTITMIVIKLELDPQGYNRRSLKKEFVTILESLSVSESDIDKLLRSVKDLNKGGKPYMRDVVESYYNFVITKKMNQDEWFNQTFPGEQ